MFIWFALFSLILIISIYYIVWVNLSSEIKSRIKIIINSTLLKKFYAGKSLRYILTFTAAYIINNLVSVESGEEKFILKTLLLSGFLIYEIISVRKRDPENWKLNPFVLAALFTFILGFGLTNFVYIIPNEFFR